jgi:RNA-directed DNA polymerase
VIDRVIQQAILQRVGRNVQRGKLWLPAGALGAVEQAQAHAASGRTWVVDIDLAKFFDRVNHDRLMAKAAERIADKRVLRLIRAS